MAMIRRFTDEQESEMRSRYEAGERTTSLAIDLTVKYGTKVTPEHIRAAVRRSGVALRPRGPRKGDALRIERPAEYLAIVNPAPTATEVAHANQESAAV